MHNATGTGTQAGAPAPVTWQSLTTELDLAEADAVRFGFASCAAARRSEAIAKDPGARPEAVKAARAEAEAADHLQGVAEDRCHQMNELVRRYRPNDARELLAKFAWILKIYAPGMDTAQPFRDFASDLEAHALTEGRTLDRLRADLAYETEEREAWQAEAIEADLCAVEAETRLAMVGGKGSHTRAA
jgi:hypothetical protein